MALNSLKDSVATYEKKSWLTIAQDVQQAHVLKKCVAQNRVIK